VVENNFYFGIFLALLRGPSSGFVISSRQQRRCGWGDHAIWAAEDFSDDRI